MGNKREIKQVIVMRKDLNMRKGKMVAQGSHASMAFLTRQGRFDSEGFKNDNMLNDEEIEQWMQEGFTKICVSVDSERELMEMYNEAKQRGLTAELIVDSGFTEFNGVPTKTCIAVGPNRAEDIDRVTGHLKLL